MWPMVGALQAWSPAVDRPDLHSTRQPQSLPDTQGLSRSCSCTWPRMRRLSRPPSAATPPPGAGGTSTGAARKGGAAPSCRPSSLPSWEPCGLLPCSPVNPCFLGAFVGFGSFLGWNLAFDGVDKGCLNFGAGKSWHVLAPARRDRAAGLGISMTAGMHACGVAGGASAGQASGSNEVLARVSPAWLG